MTAASKRHWLRFSLRKLFVVVTAAALVAAIARHPSSEWTEIAGMLWGLFWWALFCFAVVRALRRRKSPNGLIAPTLQSATVLRSPAAGHAHRDALS